MNSSTRCFGSTNELLKNREELKSYLLEALRTHLKMPAKYTPVLIELNLPYLFARDKYTAINWLSKLEAKFNADIPDNEVDLFFFSSIDEMASTILKYSSQEDNSRSMGSKN